MRIRSTALALAVLTVGCNLDRHHEILGSDSFGFDSSKAEIVSEVQIDDLRLRQVRVPQDICRSGHVDHVEMEGPIGPDTTVHLDKMLSGMKKCTTSDGQSLSKVVYLNSSGGLLSDAYTIANIFRFHEVQTVIVGGQLCASSCAIAFLGGLHRTIIGDGRLMFHSPYVDGENGIDCSDRGQVAGLRDHFISFLGPDDGRYLFERTMSYCSENDGWVIDAKTARRFNITTR